MADDMGDGLGFKNPLSLLAIRGALKVRIIGPDFDIALAMVTEEDFEIVERLLTKARCRLRAELETAQSAGACAGGSGGVPDRPGIDVPVNAAQSLTVNPE